MVSANSGHHPPADLRRQSADAVARSRHVRSRTIRAAVEPETLARVGTAIAALFDSVHGPDK